MSQLPKRKKTAKKINYIFKFQFQNRLLSYFKMIRIYIETLNDDIIALDVLPETTIESLKTWLTDHESISLDRRKLVYGETQLDDDTLTISDYDIQDESQIHIVPCESNGVHFIVEPLVDPPIIPDIDRRVDPGK